MKKIILLIAAVILLCTAQTFAAETEQAADEAKVYSFQDAVRYMNENSNVIKSQKENIKSYEYAKKQHHATRTNALKNYSYTGGVDIDKYLVGSGYAEYADDKQLAIASRMLEQSKYQLKMQLLNKFYGYLNSTNKVETALEALNNAEENARIAQEKYKAGVIGMIEMQSFSIAVTNAQNNYDSALRNSYFTMEELKKAMSYPSDKELKVSGKFEHQPMNETSLETAFEKLQTSTAMLNLNDQIDIQRELFKTYDSFYISNQYPYQEQKYALAKAEEDYQDNLYQLRLNVITAYNNMRNAYDALNYIDTAIELKESQKNAQRISYELGLSTAAEYITAIREYDDLKLQAIDAEIGAYLAAQAYEMSYYSFK